MRAAVLAFVALVGGCLEPSTFLCDADDLCTEGGEAGICEPEGFCSYPDDACEIGRRWGRFAGDGLGRKCVTGKCALSPGTIAEISMVGDPDAQLGASIAPLPGVAGQYTRTLGIGLPGFGPDPANPQGAVAVLFRSQVQGDVVVTPAGIGGLGIWVTGGTLGGPGVSVEAASDFNGDRNREFVVGAPERDSADGADVGGAFVVFGSESGRIVDLDQLPGPDGWAFVDGRGTESMRSGFRAAHLDDRNGDGIADWAVSRGTGPSGGIAFFWGRSPEDRTVFELGAPDFELTPPPDVADEPLPFEGIGDFDHDGTGDLLVGSPGAPRAWVVYGPLGGEGSIPALLASGGAIELSSRDGTGLVLGGGGKVNGDGAREVAVGNPDAEGGAGAAYVVFGRSTRAPIDLDTIELLGPEAGGIRIVGEPGSRLGASIALGQDLDCDGFGDIAVGAPDWRLETGPPEAAQGRAYVIFGGVDARLVAASDLAWDRASDRASDLGAGGVVIDLPNPAKRRLGETAVFIDDFNRDGAPDLALGAPGGDGGSVFVVHGGQRFGAD